MVILTFIGIWTDCSSLVVAPVGKLEVLCGIEIEVYFLLIKKNHSRMYGIRIG